MEQSEIKKNVKLFIEWVNRHDRVLFVAGCMAEIPEIDLADCEGEDPQLTFCYMGENDYQELYFSQMESAEFLEDDYQFHILMKNGAGYGFEVYELTRVDFPKA